MILTTFLGQNVWLLDLAPDWQTPFSADVSLVSQQESGLSNLETRRPYSATLRFHLKFRITARGADARRLAGGLRAYTIEPVMVPMWAGRVPWSARATAPLNGPGPLLWYRDDWSAWEIYQTAAGEPAGAQPNDWFVPLVQGRLEDRDLDWLSTEVVQFAVSHLEVSAATTAMVVQPMVFPAGPVPSLALRGQPADRVSLPDQLQCQEGCDVHWHAPRPHRLRPERGADLL